MKKISRSFSRPNSLDISVIIPCLNEETTIGICVQTALRSISKIKLKGEVLVVNNGSTDRSASEARKAGARVITCDVPGYGAALQKGIHQAKGKWIVMGDGDNTYDFGEIPQLIALLKNGADLAMGSRLKGSIQEQAMPWLHRWIGTPILTGISNYFFKSGISDINCGFRAFTREAVKKMDLKSEGMEFALEMVVRATKLGMRIMETPIHYYRHTPGRVSNLKTFQDGWGHFRHLLLWAR